MKNPAFPFRNGSRLRLEAWLWLSLFAACLTGCHTFAPLPPADLTQPGWQVQQGQAVWLPRREGPELAGELVVARHTDGRSFVQFTKTPWPLVVAQTTPKQWHIDFVPQNRSFNGPMPPPKRLGWLYLSSSLSGVTPPPPWEFSGTNGGWSLKNRKSGESLEGFLAP